MIPNDNNIARRDVIAQKDWKTILGTFLTWAYVIIIGGIMITPEGVNPIVTNPAVRTVAGALLVALAVIGLISMRGKSTYGKRHR